MKIVQKDYPIKKNALWLTIILLSFVGSVACMLAALKFFGESFASVAQLKLLWQLHGVKIIPTISLVLIGAALVLLLVAVCSIPTKRGYARRAKFAKVEEKIIDLQVIPEAPGIAYSYQAGNKVKNDYVRLKAVETRNDITEEVCNLKRAVLTVR